MLSLPLKRLKLKTGCLQHLDSPPRVTRLSIGIRNQCLKSKAPAAQRRAYGRISVSKPGHQRSGEEHTKEPTKTRATLHTQTLPMPDVALGIEEEVGMQDEGHCTSTKLRAGRTDIDMAAAQVKDSS